MVAIYRANAWSSAEKPIQLLSALRDSHSLATARAEGRLVGLGNAISDGHLVVYFPHLLVHPDFQRRGIGRALMESLLGRYSGFHQLMLTADGAAIAFYEALGFDRAGKTVRCGSMRETIIDALACDAPHHAQVIARAAMKP